VPIHTALGPIDAADLGPTSMHEHVFVDSRVWLEPSHERNAPPPTAPVSIETLGFLRWNPHSLEDNLIVDDPEVCVHELRRVAAAGGSGIVDMTNIGLGRRPADLPDVARRSGMHIMAGCGFYVHDSHPGWVEAASDDELEAIMVRDLVEGIDGTDVRAALIGEIGTSSPVTAREERVVRAAGRAGALTGAMVNIHLDARGAHALEILEMLTDGGQPPDRVVFSHLDERLDLGYHREVAAAGAVLEYDTFGQEFYLPNFKDPTDQERLVALAELLREGLAGQIVLGCDAWIKAVATTYGGTGIEHLFLRVAPTLESRYGVGREAIDQMLVHNPRRLLDRPPGESGAA
jgi:phosphotriesterase-related protein